MPLPFIGTAVAGAVTECSKQAASICYGKTSDLVDKRLTPIANDLAREVKWGVRLSVAMTVGYILYDRFFKK
jgi:hypothetical protein